LNPHLQAPRQRPLRSISPRLRENRNYGDLGPLAADISERGLRHPVTITRDGRLILGARRLAACALAGTDPVDCWTAVSVADVIAVIGWENEDDLDSGDAKHHLPATIAALAAQDMAMRELAWWKRGVPGAGGREGHRNQVLGALCGPGETAFLSVAQYRQLHSIAAAAAGWQSGPGGNGRLAVPAAVKRSAREALAQLGHRDTGMVNAVHHRWRNEMPQTQPTVRPLAPDGVGPLIAAITGFAGALAATGAPRQDVTGGQIEQLDRALSDGLRALNLYRRTLRQDR